MGRALWCAIFAVWTFVPLLRRMFDLKEGGYNAISPFSLLPFAVLIPPAWIAIRRWHELNGAMRAAAICWLAIFVYGMAVGFALGNGPAAPYTFVSFTLPAACGLWFSLWKLDGEKMLDFVADTLLVFVGLSAAYGLYQYVSPPAWDGLWLYSSGLFGIMGFPVPFGLRPWGTMNSPGLFAAMVAITLLVNFFVKRPLTWLRAVVLLLCLVMLLVTLVRVAWLAFAVATLVALILSPRRTRALSTLGVCLAIFVSAAGAVGSSGFDVDPAIQHVSDRISTFDDLESDMSANERQREGDLAISEAPDHPFGKGLGVLGPAAKLNPNLDQTISFDGGYFERLIEMGYPGVAGYVLIVGGILLATVRRWNRSRKRGDLTAMNAAALSVVVQAFLIWMDLGDDNHVELCGLVFWIFVALGFVARDRDLTPDAKAAA